MAYDLEKYRDKREKVLGVKKRGMSFGTIAAIVSISIITGLCFVMIPKTVAYFMTRNLDDAIYKLEHAKTWPDSVISEILAFQGVRNAAKDKHGTRLVVTFDRSVMSTGRISAFFKQKKLNTILLNHVGHRQRASTIEEEKKLEAL